MKKCFFLATSAAWFFASAIANAQGCPNNAGPNGQGKPALVLNSNTRDLKQRIIWSDYPPTYTHGLMFFEGTTDQFGAQCIEVHLTDVIGGAKSGWIKLTGAPIGANSSFRLSLPVSQGMFNVELRVVTNGYYGASSTIPMVSVMKRRTQCIQQSGKTGITDPCLSIN